jgi:hypothetical protein
MKFYSLLLMLVVCSCTTPKITSSWSTSDSIRSYKKIAVIAVVHNEDSNMRRGLEQHLAGDLCTLGYYAVSFSEAFDRNAFSAYMPYDSARMIIMDKGVDAIITITLTDKESERIFVENKNLIPNVEKPGDRENFWNYYQSARNTQSKNGQYVTSTKYVWETMFWDLSNLNLVYKSQTTSFDPSSLNQLAHKYGLLVVEDLEKNLIVRRR